MRYKTCAAFKAAPADSADAGQIEAIVSVFDNRDAYGDVIRSGAFAESLSAWLASGDPIPLLWSHQMSDPRFSIGVVTEAAELLPGDARLAPEWIDQWVKDHGGLWVKAQIDQGDDASEVAVATLKLLRKRRVTQFSFAYDVIDGGWATANGEDVYELRTLKLHEVSACQIGANDLTQLLGAKASALVSTLAEHDPARTRQLIDEMSATEVRDGLALLASSLVDKQDGKTPESVTVNGEEPSQANPEEPSRLDDESRRLLTDLDLFELEVVS